MIGAAVEMVLAVLVALGLLALGMVIYFAFHEPGKPPQPKYTPEQQARAPRPVPQAPQPSPEQVEARAIRQHQEVAQQYRELIDELYDFGEHIARRHEDQP